MIFIYNAISILILSFIFKKKVDNPKYKKIFLFLTFFQMILIQGLRDISVGTDTAMYVNTYNYYLESAKYAFQFTHFESGFRFLYNIFQNLHFNSTKMLIAISTITMIGFAVFIFKNSKNVFLSVFVFACMFYPNSFNIMRQYLALSIAINAYQFIKKEQYIKGLIIIIIGSLFHSTAWFMLLPLLLQYVKNWKLIAKGIVIFSLIFLFWGDKIVLTILPLVGKSFYAEGYAVNRLFRMTTGLTIIIAILIWYFTKNINEEDKQEIDLLSCIAWINMDFGILYLKYEFFSRIIEIVNAFLMISIPLGMMKVKSYYKPLIRIGVFCVPFLLMLNSVYNSGSGIEVYKTYFM